MPILEVADARLNYFDTGEGTPVTLLHGFTQRGRSWQELISRMPAGWRWIIPDLRGHGDTKIQPGAPCTMDACTNDLEQLWAHLDVARSHLVGYSMGGRLALHVAVKHPERLLSLLTIGAHAGLVDEARDGRRRGDEALAQRIETEGVESFVNYWSGLPMFAGLERRGPAFAAQQRAERMGNTVAGLAASLRGMGAGGMEPLWDQLGRISVPCTFVAGQLDHGYVASARRLAVAVPHGRVEVVLRAGHTVHQERPDTFAHVLAAHLRPAPEADVAGTADNDSSSTTWA